MKFFLKRQAMKKMITTIIILTALCLGITGTSATAEMVITGFGSTISGAMQSAFDSARSACPFGFNVKRQSTRYGSGGGIICTLVIECNS